MDNKELDKLFQEHLGDYREHPDPLVWNRIRSGLDQKKKKSRLIPIWWRWGAAAAVLLGTLFLTTPWKSSDLGTSPVTNTETGPSNPIPEIRQESRDPESSTNQEIPAMVADKESEKGNSSKAPSKKENRQAEGGITTGLAQQDYSQNTTQTSGVDTEPTVAANNVRDDKEPVLEQQSVDNAIAAAEKDRFSKEKNPDKSGITEEKNEVAAVEQTPKKSIFDAIEESEEVAEVSDEGGKWSLGPSLAPVYFNSFGEGSPIAPNFVDNSKSGSLNMSYGLQVSYKVSKKIRIRSGVHRVDYGYNTNDVGFTSAPTARPSSLIRTISYSEESKSLIVQSMVSDPAPMNPNSVDVTAPNPAREGQMVQEFGYLEVPLEMQFSLIDKKFGMDLIGGMSSLFLVNNSVSLESSGTVTEVGEATNMNSLNFSTNLGLGFYYRLNPNFELNLQPMFKYQLNTFSETTGSFNPYSIGIYSGLSFRF